MKIVSTKQSDDTAKPAGGDISLVDFATKETPDNILLNEALFLHGQGVGVYLADPKTNLSISRHSEFEPITDREQLTEMCMENPDSNLNIAIDREQGLVALAVGVGNEKELAEESFRKLHQQYGKLRTVGYKMPSGETYFLFKYDQEGFDVKDKPGLRFLNSIDCIAVYPSNINGQQVQKVGTTDTVRELSSWLGQDGVTDIDTEAQQLSEPEESKPAIAPRASIENIAPVEESIQQLGVEVSSVQESAEVEDISKNLPAIAVIPEPELKEEKTHQQNTSQGTSAEMDDLTQFTDIVKQITLFRDDLSEPHFYCEGIPFPAPSKHVENWARHSFMKIKKRLPNRTMVREIFDMLESEARFESPQYKLYNRVAKRDDTILYDLCDKRYVVITVDSWNIEIATPLFRRYKHQQPQFEPLPGGDAWLVFKYIAVPEEQKLLILVYIICLFAPEIAHPLLAVCGDQGSAKTFTCNVINRLVDPTLTEKIIIPKNERDLLQTLRQKYVTVLDNLSLINQRVSDILCQVCTGGGLSYRQYYTNEGENIAQFRHAVILNSITLPIINADLMDRSIILKLQRIMGEDRKTEQELWSSFDEDKASVLGGIFDILVKAMAIYPTVKLESSPRLADFAKFGYAVAEALGNKGKQFIEDYSKNVANQSESVANNNVLCQSVLTLMVDKANHERSVADAYLELHKIAGADAKDSTFPKLPHNLRGQLEKLQSTLKEFGITYQFSDRTKAGFKVTFTNSNYISTSEPPPSQDASDRFEQSDTSRTSGAPQSDNANHLNNKEDAPDASGVPEPPTFDFGGEAVYV